MDVKREFLNAKLEARRSSEAPTNPGQSGFEAWRHHQGNVDATVEIFAIDAG